MVGSTIRYKCYSRTELPPQWVTDIVGAFTNHEANISTMALPKGLISNDVLAILRPSLERLGFVVESSREKGGKIPRPVFFGENGTAELTYEVDAYHEKWLCGFEVEAGRATHGNAVYRDLIQAAVMVQVETLVLAVPNSYKYKLDGKERISNDYEKTVSIAETLYSHSRFRLPYRLVVIGY